MRADFPFFRSFEVRADKVAGDVRVLAEVADSGACVAAKDISMAGLVGSLAMLLEHGRFGVTVDLDRLPRPGTACPWSGGWPASPASASCCASRRVARTTAPDPSASAGLEAAVVGEIDSSGQVALRRGAERRHRHRPVHRDR